MRTASRPTILIADDHTLVAEAFKTLIEPDFEVLGIVGNGQALIDRVQQSCPDIVMLDVSMPLMNGLDAGERIRKLRKTVKIVYLTMNPDRAIAAEAFRRGASGFLLKTSAASELVYALRAVLNGKSFVSKLVAADAYELKVEYEGVSGPPGKLTDRQKQVLQLLAEGRSMKEVANVLDLTARTVAFHKYRIMDILHLRNNSELVQYAIKEHLLV
jgi:DNA-binding NarL/FixJ family response regulator